MIRADTGSLQLCERPVVQPVSLCFARSFSGQNTAQSSQVASMGYKSPLIAEFNCDFTSKNIGLLRG
jgi:hypothetical protein